LEPQEIVIDPEFKGLIPPLTDDERRDLEASLKADGCISPLVVWYEHNILLDGHNRHELCLQHDIECEVHEIVLDSREAAKAWIIRNQLGRRNLNESQRSLLATELEKLFTSQASQRQEASRTKPGQKVGAKASANLQTPCASPSGSGSAPFHAAREAARAMNVSERLVHTAKKVKESGTPALQQAVLAGQVSVSAASEVAKLPPKQQDDLVAKGPKAVRDAAKRAREKRRGAGGLSPKALTPVHGHSKPDPKTALELPHDPAYAAKTLMSVFPMDYLTELVRELTHCLEGDRA